MGMLDSFKNQVARDAGKVTSNFLFGDKHAAQALPVLHNINSKR